jgi:hypothetical protein
VQKERSFAIGNEFDQYETVTRLTLVDVIRQDHISFIYGHCDLILNSLLLPVLLYFSLIRYILIWCSYA